MTFLGSLSKRSPANGACRNREFTVGDKLKVKLHDGRIVDATVRAIVDDGEKLQVVYGHEETALAETSQVVG